MIRRGFSLVELIVVGIITAGLAGATTMALSQALRARDTSEARYEAFVSADAAARAISRDIANIVRDGDLYYTRFFLVSDGRDGSERDEVLVFARSSSRARAGKAPEGAEYEIQYRIVEPIDREKKKIRGEATRHELWKRIDPVPDEFPDGGGVVFPLAENLTSLSIVAFDGNRWLEEWDSDLDGYPHAISVTVRSLSGDGSRTSTARRIIAIDRTPVPYASVSNAEDEEDGERGGS